MKRSNLFFSFLISLTFAGPAAVCAENQVDSEQPGQKSVTEIVNDVLLLYGGSGITGSGGSGGGVVSTGGGSGSDGGGTVSTGGGGTTGHFPHPNIINVVSSSGQSYSLTKINSLGEEVPAVSDAWSCLKDNINNLVWEVKTSDGGLHDQADSFSWYDPDQLNATKVGFADNSGASCKGYVAGDPSTYCNTNAYVTRVNTNSMCGKQGWRLPAIGELQSLVGLNNAAPELYSSLFPKGTNRAVWSASQHTVYPGFAWHIYLNDGYSYGNDKSGNLPVLLVRNAQ